MDSVLALLIAFVVALRVWNLPKRLTTLQEELAEHKAAHNRLYVELERLRTQLALKRKSGAVQPIGGLCCHWPRRPCRPRRPHGW